MAGSVRDSEGYVVAGDGLRGLAALAIIAFHGFLGVRNSWPPDDPVAWGFVGDLCSRLNVGLYVLLALSGYLISGPWVRAYLAGTPFPSARRYVLRRVRRLVPAFWLVVTVTVLWFGTFGAGSAELLAVYAFAQVLAPEGPVQYVLPQTWSLGVEVGFYAAIPLLAVLVHRRGWAPVDPAARLKALLGLLAAAFGVSFVLRLGPPDSLTAPGARTVLSFAWAFVPGVALAAVEPTARRVLPGSRAGRRAALLLVAWGVLSIVWLVAFRLDDGRLATLVAYTGCGTGLVAGALVWQWVTGGAPRWITTRPMHALGRWSYGIYLVHVGIGAEALRHVPGGFGAWGTLAFVLAAMWILSVAVAGLMWWLVEQPVITGRPPSRPGSRSRSEDVRTPTGPAPSAAPGLAGVGS